MARLAPLCAALLLLACGAMAATTSGPTPASTSSSTSTSSARKTTTASMTDTTTGSTSPTTTATTTPAPPAQRAKILSVEQSLVLNVPEGRDVHVQYQGERHGELYRVRLTNEDDLNATDKRLSDKIMETMTTLSTSLSDGLGAVRRELEAARLETHNNLTSAVASLTTELNTKATKQTVNTLQLLVNTKASTNDLAALQNDVNSRATAAALSSLQTVVNTKANTADLNVLRTLVNTKASAADLAAARSTAATATATVASNLQTFQTSAYAQLGARWPDLEPMTVTPPGWSGRRASNTIISTCGRLGKMMGGFPNVHGRDFVSKTFQLPAHTSVNIRLTYFFVDSWDGTERGEIYVDNTLRWAAQYTAGRSMGNVCGGVWAERLLYVDITVPHTAPTLTLRVTGTHTQAATDESFGIANLFVGDGGQVAWPVADVASLATGSPAGWTGTNLDVQSCGILGDFIGGYNRLGRGATLQKTFFGLPQHTRLVIKFDFLFVDSWDGERAFMDVDDVVRWNFYHVLNRDPNADYDECGRPGARWPEYVYHGTVGVADHTSSQVKIRFRTDINGAPNDESWGLNNVQVTGYA